MSCGVPHRRPSTPTLANISYQRGFGVTLSQHILLVNFYDTLLDGSQVTPSALLSSCSVNWVAKQASSSRHSLTIHMESGSSSSERIVVDPTPTDSSERRGLRNASFLVRILTLMDSIPRQTRTAVLEYWTGHLRALFAPQPRKHASFRRRASVRTQFSHPYRSTDMTQVSITGFVDSGLMSP